MTASLLATNVFDELMAEIWLRTNMRAMLVALLLPAAGFALGAVVVVISLADVSVNWLTLLGGLFMALAVAALGALVHRMRTPRLAYENEHLLLFLGQATPFRIPVKVVECFFLGQTPALLSGSAQRNVETRTIVVRLAEAADSWKNRDVKPTLGHWCNGYVTIHGTWCEPITPELVKGLNHRLLEIHRQQRAEREKRKDAT